MLCPLPSHAAVKKKKEADPPFRSCVIQTLKITEIWREVACFFICVYCTFDNRFFRHQAWYSLLPARPGYMSCQAKRLGMLVSGRDLMLRLWSPPPPHPSLAWQARHYNTGRLPSSSKKKLLYMSGGLGVGGGGGVTQDGENGRGWFEIKTAQCKYACSTCLQAGKVTGQISTSEMTTINGGRPHAHPRPRPRARSRPRRRYLHLNGSGPSG